MSYVCYLLQSVSRPEKTYIGITLDLERRLEEHNGLRPNGARRTMRYRPWRIAMHVAGFSRKSAALAFEYRWSHYGSLQNLTPQRRKLKLQLEILGYVLRLEAFTHCNLRLYFFNSEISGIFAATRYGNMYTLEPTNVVVID